MRKRLHAWELGLAGGGPREPMQAGTCAALLNTIPNWRLRDEQRAQAKSGPCPQTTPWKEQFLMSVQGQLPLVVMIYKGELSPLPQHVEILLHTPKSTQFTKSILSVSRPEEEFHPHTICVASQAQRPPDRSFEQ